MITKKRYTNQTFTKRPDHEGGAHRPPATPNEPAYCKECGAIYSEKHWVAKSAVLETAEHPHWKPLKPVTCPACAQIRSGVVGGYFEMTGEFLANHREEIEGLIANEAREALQDNPLSRVMGQLDEDGKLVVTTTTEHLAQRLGHAVQKAYNGETNYDFSHENKVLRVHWVRN